MTAWWSTCADCALPSQRLDDPQAGTKSVCGEPGSTASLPDPRDLEPRTKYPDYCKRQLRQDDWVPSPLPASEVLAGARTSPDRCNLAAYEGWPDYPDCPRQADVAPPALAHEAAKLAHTTARLSRTSVYGC